MTKTLMAAALAWLGLPTIALAMPGGGDPISMNPDHLELEICLAGARAGFLDKSLCEAQWEQRMQQKTLELLPSLAIDPKLLLGLPGYDALIRR